jgi:galactokinase
MGATPRRWSIWVPGRIEVLGKHTDYAGGRSLVCAIERGLCVRVAARRDTRVRVRSVGRRGGFETDVGAPVAGDPGSWSQYVASVVRRLNANFDTPLRGADIAVASDLPQDAGMSSSSALVVATFIALSKTNDLRSNRAFREAISSSEELAGYLGAVENGRVFRNLGTGDDAGVGTHGGSQDHTAILCSEPNQLARFSWDPLRREGLYPLPPGLVFALGSCGVDAPKSGSARESYNAVSLAATRLLELWNRDTRRTDRTLGSVLGNTPGAVDHIRGLAMRDRKGPFKVETLVKRLDQFGAETFVLIPAASDALARGDMTGFGIVVDRSMFLAENNLGNQVPETVTLQRSARELGAVAASAFGAGFGGSVWALVPEADATSFLRRWKATYRRQHPGPARESVFFLSKAGPHAYQF